MNIWTSINSQTVLAEFEARLNHLKTTPYEKLKESPERVQDTAKIDGQNITFTTYRHITKNDDLEIVLQISIPSRKLLFIKVARVYAEGFCIASSGELHPLPKEALVEYM